MAQSGATSAPVAAAAATGDAQSSGLVGIRPAVKPVDVLLLLEGTYPYVAGGVSSWVHGLISDLPELRFGILYLAPSWEGRTRKYSLPPNLEYIQEISALDLTAGWAADRPIPARMWEVLESFQEGLQDGHVQNFAEIYELLGQTSLRHGSFLDLTRGPQSWDILGRLYQKYAREAPFIDFDYCWRASVLPILHLLGSSSPNARVIHTVCTGWAGFLGTLARWLLVAAANSKPARSIALANACSLM